MSLRNVRFPLVGEHKWFTHLKVAISYYKDGIDSRRPHRGYYMSCSPVRLEDWGDYKTETERGGDGVLVFIAETARNTKKRQEQICNEELNLDKLNDKESRLYKVVDYVCRKHNLHITECALKDGEFSVR